MFVQCSAPHSFIQKLSQALASLPSTTLILLLLTSLEIDIDLSKKWNELDFKKEEYVRVLFYKKITTKKEGLRNLNFNNF